MCRQCKPGQYPGPPPFEKCAFPPFSINITDNSNTFVSDWRTITVNNLYTNAYITYDSDNDSHSAYPQPYTVNLRPDEIYEQPLNIKVTVFSYDNFVQIIMPSYKKFFVVDYHGNLMDLPENKGINVYAGENSYVVTKKTDPDGTVNLRVDPPPM